MIKVLSVCHGNIFHSPMAEFIFRDMLKKYGRENGFVISSSATSTEEIWNGIGNPVYPPAKAEPAKHGISCNGKIAVQLKKAIMTSMICFSVWTAKTSQTQCVSWAATLKLKSASC